MVKCPGVRPDCQGPFQLCHSLCHLLVLKEGLPAAGWAENQYPCARGWSPRWHRVGLRDPPGET